MSNAIEQRLAALSQREQQLETELRDVRIRLSELRALAAPNGAAPVVAPALPVAARSADAPVIYAPRPLAPRGALEAAVRAVFTKNPGKKLSNNEVRRLVADGGFPYRLDAQNVSPVLKQLTKERFLKREGRHQFTTYVHKP
ncbi:MAG TPA: hypothetical protein VEC57_00020 [Candidatus Limnocylindrales bacterium]|nr:hypothetical protein [Candidatus Limnocylindrales bacterium]